MGTIAARQASEILENVRGILAIELLAAAQGLDFLKPLEAGEGTNAAYLCIRQFVTRMDEDRIPAADIKVIYSKILDETIINEVEATIGELFGHA